MAYNQFCPVAKAMEVLGEKWTLLIVRELLMGATRFNELQRGLSSISPTLLSKRLVHLEHEGLVARRRIPGQRGFEYFPTEACRELRSVVENIGAWGMRWARSQMSENDYDLELLMLYLERSIQPGCLPGKETVVRFHFTDVRERPNWWIVITPDNVDVCMQNPGKQVDLYFNVSIRLMAELWMGTVSYRQVLENGELEIIGPKALAQNIPAWLKPSMFAGIPPADRILPAA